MPTLEESIHRHVPNGQVSLKVPERILKEELPEEELEEETGTLL